jgi:hypothetical protein
MKGLSHRNDDRLLIVEKVSPLLWLFLKYGIVLPVLRGIVFLNL